MKKTISTLILSAAMMLTMASVSMANSLYYDTFVSGNVKSGTDVHSYDDAEYSSVFNFDTKSYTLGGKYQINDNFSISGEYSRGNQEDDTWTTGSVTVDVVRKVTNYKLKGGYTIINKPNVKVDITAGYYNQKMDDTLTSSIGSLKTSGNVFSAFGDSKITSSTIGIDTLTKIARNTTLEAGFDYGINPELTLNDEEQTLDSLYNLRVSCNYYVIKNLALTLGYRLSKYEGGDYDIESTTKGITAGIRYAY